MNRLSQLRQEKGLNMREAARGLNMPYTTYVNYEKGTREPNSETLIALAEFYGVSIDYLLCGSPAARQSRQRRTWSAWSVCPQNGTPPLR